ncbi:hypothetical protein UlMin_016186 [Ulmus minor]
MFRARDSWARLWTRFKIVESRRPFSDKPSASGNGDKAGSSLTKYDESYRQLDNLDFMTAAKMLFSEPPKKKKFGFDFHLVQFFFALMPSFAVYLVAQYARYEMRKMEKDLEKKKKKEEEEKAKELELNAAEKEEENFPGLLEVKTRLEKLEETVKEIAVESKKQSGSGLEKSQEGGNEKKHLTRTETSNRESSSEPRPPLGQGSTSSSPPLSNKGASQDDKK